MQYKVTCPSCSHVTSYSVPIVCKKCNGHMGWASGDYQWQFKGLECLDCGDTIWSVSCENCDHDIPLIGKLAKFDDSDDMFLIKVINWFSRNFGGAKW